MLRFLVLFALVFSFFTLSSEEEALLNVDFSELATKKTGGKRKKREPRYPIQKTSKPYIVSMNAIQERGSVFFQTNIGLGLLYFHQVRGNLGFTPAPLLPNSIPFKRGLAYNRTPLFEYLIGYRASNWLKLSLSYQNQTGVIIQTDMLPFRINGGEPRWAQYRAHLSLNSLMLKTFIESPYALIWKKVVYSPFFAFGLGASWQSWSPQIVTDVQQTIGYVYSGNIPYRPQSIANFSFMLDKGLRIQPASINAAYSALLGFKFMFWGQARNLSKLQKQGPLKLGLFKPFKIKTIYSLVPYLGFQWNFQAKRDGYKVPKRADRRKFDRFFINQKLITPAPALVTQFNVGPNFLYFSGINGNLALTPLNVNNTSGRDVPYNKRFQYNKAPIYEYFVGSQPKHWCQIGLSVQSQTNVIIDSQWVPAFLASATPFTSTDAEVKFRASLNLTAAMVKAYFYMPLSLRAGFMSFNFYGSFGVGPSWQSWNTFQTASHQLVASAINPETTVLLRSKTVCNPAFQVDFGYNVKGIAPESPFLLSMGCRFNFWGQIRNLGKLEQQGTFKSALLRPVRVKTLYSFAPYLGFQWNFLPEDARSIKKIVPGTWRPVFVPTRDLDKRKGILVSANLGPNFLRFARVRGNIGGEPFNNIYDASGQSPIKGRLRRNASLLFEYLFGYQFNNWVKLTTSFQMQEGLYISSPNIQGSNATFFAPSNQFNASLSLYSLMLKGYFEIPETLIIKNLATSFYGALGCGAGWQSWSSLEMFRSVQDSTHQLDTPQYMRPKACANLVWMVDFGLRIRGASLNSRGSVTLGCKYNQWGQARNLGAQDQSWNNYRMGLIEPVRIRIVYSWAPYMGFQWSF